MYPDRPDIQPDDHEQAIGPDPVAFGGMWVWVLSQTYVDEVHDNVRCKCIRLRVRLVNVASDEQSWFSRDFSLVHPSGEIRGPALFSGPESLAHSGGLVQGGQVEGNLWFLAPQAAPGAYFVRWEPSWEYDDDNRGIWSFAL